MQFLLSIQCDSAAFDPDISAELEMILQTAINKLDLLIPGHYISLRDTNKNKVGTMALTEKE